VASPPPAINDRTEMGTVIIVGVIILFGIVIVMGILVAARGLDRGESLLQQPTRSPTPSARWSDQDPSDDAPPSSSDRSGENRPQDAVEREVSELDARFAPPGGADDGAPESDGDRPGNQR
jgi:hypothetical protein